MANKGIEDIILKSKENQNSFFNEYLDQKAVSSKIFNGIIGQYQKGKGFAIDDKNPNLIGIISNTMALSIFLELYDLETEELKNHYGIFSELLSLIFASIYQNENKLTFDASPYIFNDSEKNIIIDSYIETVSKVLIVMVDMRDLLIDCLRIPNENIAPKSSIKFNVEFKGKIITEPDVLIVKIEGVIIECFKLLSKSALKLSEPFEYKIGNQIIKREGIPEKCEYRGWTFKGDNEKHESYETSIYFTYHATNAFLSYYYSFYHIYNKSDESNIDEYHMLKRERDQKFYEGNKTIIDELRSITSSSARYIEKIINERGIDLSSDFINSNLNKVSYAGIQNYQPTNSVIETLFIVAIYLNGGLDDDYAWLNQTDYFFDKISYAITNIKKIYTAFQKDKKEDFISSYKLLFNEKIPEKYDEIIQKFRKNCQNIRVYDLPPLLLNTYYTIIDFLIMYPTIEMNNYLKMIMNNRNDNDQNNKRWYWDKDGFNININLYYIFAIENFYQYYYKYENPLSENGNKYNRDVEKANKIAEKRKVEIENLKMKWKKSEEELKNYKSPLDQAFENFVFKTSEEKLNKYLDKYFEEMINQNINLCVDRKNSMLYGKPVSNNELFNSYPKAKILRKLVLAMEANTLLDEVNDITSENKNIENEIHVKMLKIFEDDEKIKRKKRNELQENVKKSEEK